MRRTFKYQVPTCYTYISYHYHGRERGRLRGVAVRSSSAGRTMTVLSAYDGRMISVRRRASQNCDQIATLVLVPEHNLLLLLLLLLLVAAAADNC